MPFNEQLPEWNAPGVEPPASKKATGWDPGERPPADYWNWQMNRTYKALQELQQKAAEKEEVESVAQAADQAWGQAVLARSIAELHASRHAADGPDPITPEMIGAETPAGAQAKADQAETNAKAYANATFVPKFVYLNQGDDLNNVVTSGFYKLNNNHANAPAGTSYGQLIVSQGGDTILQIISGGGRYYVRQATGIGGASPVWQPWRELITDMGDQTITGKLNVLGGLNAALNKWWIQDGEYAFDLRNSDIVGANCIIFEDATDSPLGEGIFFPKSEVPPRSRNISDYDVFRILNGVMYLNSNTVWHSGNSGPFYRGSGSPEGNIPGPPGSLYLNSTGGSGTTLWVKRSGTGNTGWFAVA